MKINTHSLHAFAYRLLLLSVLFGDHIHSELVRDLIRVIPYVLLSFDIVLYSPATILQRLARSRRFRFFLIAAYLSAAINVGTENQCLPQYHGAMREDAAVYIEAEQDAITHQLYADH